MSDANADDPGSLLRQRPLLTLDEVITPQVGSCTVFARYVEAGFATQVILNARLTRLYEREDWKRLLNTSGEALQLERGVARAVRPHPETDEPDPTGGKQPASSIETAARQTLAKIELERKQPRLL